MGRTIPVMMAFDRGYLFPSCVAIHSVLEQADPADRYRFYILTAEENVGMDDGFFELLAAKFPNFAWEYRPVAVDMFANSRPAMRYISTATYYRLLIPCLFPELEYCIYLDGDLVALGDIAGMLDCCMDDSGTPFSDCYLAAAKDVGLQAGTTDYFIRHRSLIGFSDEDLPGYFNAGVLVMNLKKIREDRLEERFISLLAKDYTFADQDILNVACKGKVRLLPVRFNLVANNIGNRYYAYHVCGDPRDREDLLAGRPVICHYVGEAKPWQLLETPWDQAWFACAKRVPATPELARWIARCGERQAPPWTYRTDAVRNAGQVVLYGYTYFSRFLCEALLDEGCGNIRCFLDRDPQKQGSSFRGIPCLGPELLDGLPEDALIVICAQTAWQEITAQLQARGIPRDRLARYRARDHALISV